MASTLEGLENVLDGEAWLCNCRAGVIIGSSLVLVGVEMGGAGLMKTHEGEGGEAPGGTALLGAELPGQIRPQSRGASVAPTGAR